MTPLRRRQLCCPDCRCDTLKYDITQSEGERLLNGTVACKGCGREYPLRDGILNFLSTEIGEHTRKVSGIFSQSFVETYKRRWSKAGHRATELALTEGLSRFSEGQSGTAWLDVGAGFCKYSQVLLANGVCPVAMDISEDMLSVSREQLSDEEWLRVDQIVADATKLPFVDSCFDGWICINVFQYLENPEACLRELVRVTKPDGRFVLHLLNLLDLRAKYLAFNLISKMARALFSKRMMDGYRNLYSRPGMSRGLARHGLDVYELRGVNLYPPLVDILLNRLSADGSLGHVGLACQRALDSVARRIWPFSQMYNAYLLCGRIDKTV